MDSTEAPFGTPMGIDNAYKSMETLSLKVVARDGIEPPTPAFSGLASSCAIILITKDKSHLNVPKTVLLLGQ